METRYTGESTLDEPVSKTIVSRPPKGLSSRAKALRQDARFAFHLLQIVASPLSSETGRYE